MEIKICPYCEGTGVSKYKNFKGENNDSCTGCLGAGRVKVVSFEYMLPFLADDYDIAKNVDMIESIIKREFESL